MRLISLTANDERFRTINFNRTGLSIILGTGSPRSGPEGSSNGVGKTLALRLVHFCLGGQSNARLASALPDWVFTLRFEIDGHEHCIERSSDSHYIRLDGYPIGITKLREWLNDSGVFVQPDIDVGGLFSFRSLFKRFARVDLQDCVDPESVPPETPYQKLVRTLFLMGLDIHLPIHKYKLKQEIDQLGADVESAKNNSVLIDFFRQRTDVLAVANSLREQIPALEQHLHEMKVADDYRAIEDNINSLTEGLREVEEEIEINNFRLSQIRELLVSTPDISSMELRQLYEGLLFVFRPETLRHFEDVEAFHQSLAHNRRRRLTAEVVRIEQEIRDKEQKRQAIVQERQRLLDMVQGKTALDEYATIANSLAEKRTELSQLERFIDFEANTYERIRQDKVNILEVVRRGDDYLSTNPLQEMDARFRELTRRLYPDLASGISLRPNARENQILYDLSVYLDTHDSDGVNNARIICFDWILFMHGSNHTMEMLWHDNRLFADMDPKPRAAWLKFANYDAKHRDRQYVVSLNVENYESMRAWISDEDWRALEESKVLELSGEVPSRKLLGVQINLS